MITGLDFGGNVKITTPAKNYSNADKKTKNTKYINIAATGEYLVRLVSGYVPFSTHFIPSAGFLICPKTLLMGFKKIGENGLEVYDRLHKKPDNSFYTDEEAFCPICAKEGSKSPLTRYAVNVIDRTEQKYNVGGPVPIRILTSNFDIFKEFMAFTNSERPYSPQDYNHGWDFLIKTFEVPGKENSRSYSVQPIKQTPLTQIEQQAALTKRAKGSEIGVWDLMSEYHPLTCAAKMSVFHNPTLISQQAAASQQVVQAPITSPAQPVYTQQPASQQYIQQPQVVQEPTYQQPVAQPQPTPQQYVQQPQAQPVYTQQPTPQQYVQQPQIQPTYAQQPMPQQYVQQPQQPQQYVQQPTSPVQTVQSQIVPIDANVDPADAIAKLMQGL